MNVWTCLVHLVKDEGQDGRFAVKLEPKSLGRDSAGVVRPLLNTPVLASQKHVNTPSGVNTVRVAISLGCDFPLGGSCSIY